MNNQECKVRTQIVNLNGTNLYFFLLVLKQVNAVVVATKSIIHIQNCVLMMLLKSVKVFNLMSRTDETRHTE